MTIEFYQKITKPYLKHPRLLKTLKILNYAITIFTFLSYSALLSALLFTRDERFLRVLLTPALSLIVVDIMRRAIPARRPYEKLDITPLIKKNKKMKSFPSRHVYSIYVIAMTFFYCFYPIGIILSVLGIFMAYVRVVGGIHFPKDVVAGGVIGVLSGIIGLYIIP